MKEISTTGKCTLAATVKNSLLRKEMFQFTIILRHTNSKLVSAQIYAHLFTNPTEVNGSYFEIMSRMAAYSSQRNFKKPWGDKV